MSETFELKSQLDTSRRLVLHEGRVARWQVAGWQAVLFSCFFPFPIFEVTSLDT